MGAFTLTANSMGADYGSATFFCNRISKPEKSLISFRKGSLTSWMLKKRPLREREVTPRQSKSGTIWCSACHSRSTGAGVSDKELLVKQARNRFCEEISFGKRDEEVSVVKAMLLISAEDEAFMSANREKDNLAVRREGYEVPDVKLKNHSFALDHLPLDGKTMSTWLLKFDSLWKEVADILAINGSCYNPLQILKAVDAVLFEVHGFSRSFLVLDPMKSYLHHVLTYGSGTAIMLSIIFMEVCHKLGINMVGSEVGNDFFIWPATVNTQAICGLSEDSKSWVLELKTSFHSQSLARSMVNFVYGFNRASNATLQLASNRDIIGIALRNLKNLHWKQACSSHPNFTITGPLDPLSHDSKLAAGALLRPQDLRLAVMASERLVMLQPHSWNLRRDHGLLLYHSRKYGEAVLELSICMALAPTEEAEILEHFVEKLHLMRRELSWNSFLPPSTASKLGLE